MRSSTLDGHPAADAVARFLRGAASVAESRHLVRHLLAGCEECRQTIGNDWRRSAPASAGTAGGEDGGTGALPSNVLPFPAAGVGERAGGRSGEEPPPLDRVIGLLARHRRQLAEERRETPALLARLDAMSPADRLAAMRTTAAFQRWAFIASLIDDSRAEGFSQPERALELAELALAGAESLDAGRYPAELVADLAARAWAGRGNALRILGRFAEAGESLDRAAELLRSGSGDPVERCRVLMMTASLRSREGRLAEADGLLDRALDLAVRCGDRHLQGNALVRKSRVAQRRDDTEAALDLLDRAQALIDPEADARLLLTARHNHVLLMVETGRYREALDRMEETRSLHLRFGGRIDFLRFRWLEGRIYAGLGWLRQAAGHYEDVRRAFVTAGLAWDVALVSLDLAAVCAQEGRTARVRELAEEILPIFRSREAHREAIATLLVFQDAARQEVATVRLIRHVAEELRRVRREPEIGLRPLDGSG